MLKRIVSLILFMTLLLTLTSGIFTVSAVYENTYVNTGNGQIDIVEIAKTQVGYYEGMEQYAGYTKYGDWYRNYMNESSAFVTAAWCAMFVSWCANEAGIIDKTGSFAYCPYWVAYFKEIQLWKSRASGYFPKAGDIIFFADNGTLASHVGIVYEANSSYVYTIEGNTADACLYRAYSLSDTYILGYGIPNYSGEGTLVGETWRTTASGGLNLRSNAGTEYPVLTSIIYNAHIIVTEKIQANGITWGKTVYNGVTGYCALSYAVYVGEVIVPDESSTPPPVLPQPINGERVYITGCNTAISWGSAVVVNKLFNGTNTVLYNELGVSWSAYLVAAPTATAGVYQITLKGEHLQSGSLTIPEGGIIFAAHCDDRDINSTAYINSRANKIATNAFNIGDKITLNGVNFTTGAVGATATLEKHTQSGTEILTLISNSRFSIDRANNYLMGVKDGDTTADINGQFINSNISFGSQTIGTGCTVQTADDSLVIIIKGDLSGDGRVTSVDYLMLKRVFLGTLELADAQVRAGCIGGGATPTSSDYLKIKRHFLGTFNIYAA